LYQKKDTSVPIMRITVCIGIIKIDHVICNIHIMYCKIYIMNSQTNNSTVQSDGTQPKRTCRCGCGNPNIEMVD